MTIFKSVGKTASERTMYVTQEKKMARKWVTYKKPIGTNAYPLSVKNLVNHTSFIS